MANSEFDRLFSSPYEDVLRSREMLGLENNLVPGMTFSDIDELCLEALDNGFLTIAEGDAVLEGADVRSSMQAIKDKSLSRRDYRGYADDLIQVVVDEVDPVPGETAGIAISSRGGIPFELPLFGRLPDADSGFTQQTRHEVTGKVNSTPSKMGDFEGRHTYSGDLMCATAESTIDILMQSQMNGGEKFTALVGFTSPQAIARMLLSKEIKISRIVSLPLEAGLIDVHEKARNFIIGGVAKKYEKFTEEELRAIMEIFMLGDHGNRYYKVLTEAH